jgi:predicted ATPase
MPETDPPMRLTRWCVITGAPCAGKTAVVSELAQRGYRVVPEAARSFIDGELKKGRRLAEIKSEPALFEGMIFRTKLDIEARLPAHERLFLDRALPDSIAYYLLEGLDPSEPRRHSRKVRYNRVFLFERIEFAKDLVRSEDAIIAARLEWLIEEAYRDLGYPIVRVPLMPIPARADFVLAHV